MKRIVDSRMGETVCRDRLGGGLDFWAVPRLGSRQKAAVLCVDFGSVDLEISARTAQRKMGLPAGTAHFIEHRLFEKKYGDISDRFNALGGDINASTSFSSTVFTLKCVDNFAENLHLLFELVFDFQVSAEGVGREREVIERELRSSSDDPAWVGFLHGLKSLYGEVPISLDMAGTTQSIAAIDADILATCHEVFYRPEHMGLFLCGEFDCAAIAEFAEADLAKYHRKEPQWEKTMRPLTVPAPLATAGFQLPINRPFTLFFFGDERVGISGRELLRRELAFELALDIAFGPASDFFAKHYGEGLNIGDDFGAEVYIEPTFGFCVLGGFTEHGGQLADLVEVTLRQIEGWIENDFRRAKHKSYGQLMRSCEHAEEIADFLCSAAINGAEPWDYFDVYEDIAVEHVCEVLHSCLSAGSMESVHIQPSGQSE